MTLSHRDTRRYLLDGVIAHLVHAVRRVAVEPVTPEGQEGALWFLKQRIGVEGPVMRAEAVESEDAA